MNLDPGILSSVKDIWTLIGLIILSIVYLITMFYKQKQTKKQTKDLSDSFNTQTKELIVRIEMQNEKIIKKLDDIHEVKNDVDLQTAMDIIYTILTESMYCIIEEIEHIVNDNTIDKKEILKEKVNNLVENQCKEDVLIMNRIYFHNIKLTEFIRIDKSEIVEEICKRLYLIRNKKQTYDVIDYIKNKFQQIIQASQLEMSNIE